MPRKVFVAGEILTAADVNTNLMDQSVMVFADDTARGSAIPSPSEGMVTYREDDDTVEVFDGSAYKPIGGLVATKSVLKTDTFSASVTASNNVAVTGLSITHTLQNAANKLIISAYFGAAATTFGKGSTGIAVADDGTLIGTGDSSGSRTQVSAGGIQHETSTTSAVSMPSAMFVYAPGENASHTYTVRAINVDGSTRTLFVNRSEGDSNLGEDPRSSSALVIQEVAV